MEALKELSISEMIQISGGVNPAYDLGYAIGHCIREIILFKGIMRLFV